MNYCDAVREACEESRTHIELAANTRKFIARLVAGSQDADSKNKTHTQKEMLECPVWTLERFVQQLEKINMGYIDST
jgi:hypothetical protein